MRGAGYVIIRDVLEHGVVKRSTLVKKEKSVINSASARWLRFSAPRACLHALAASLAVFATGLLPVSAQNDATNRPPVQTFYLPIPEEDLLQTLTSIHGGASWTLPAEPIESYNSIVVFVDGTVIYYDQWEDGYEQDIANPNHIYSAANPTGTQIWGDGDPSNGAPPGYENHDRLYAGNVIVLSSEVKVNGRNPAKQVYFDGSDKIGVSRPVAITRAVWASQSKTLFAGANEVYDTTFFGTEFVVPVGENTANQNEIFQYTGATIMAGAGGATVSVDLDANGTYDRTATLAEGQTFLVDGGLKQGAKIKATGGSVQVNLLTGDIYDGYESRFITLLPTHLWSSAYTSPVATPTTTKVNRTTYNSGTKIWLYNPSSSQITVYYDTATVTARSISVPAKSSAYVVAGAKTTTSSDTFTGSTTSGVYVRSKNGEPFYAIATVDSTGTDTSTKTSGGDNRTWDWGFALVPDSSMSSQIVVGLGLGRDPTSSTSQSENGAPIWVVADKDTTLYVDYDGNPDTPAIAANTDAHGSHYDMAIDVKGLEIAKVYNPSGDQTGMLIYTLNGAKIAAAWGEDPATASPGQPGLDLGTGIPPMPEWVMRKSSKLVVDADDDGFMTPGDTIEYTVEFLNVGRQPVSGLTLKDELPADVTYVANSSAFSSTHRVSSNNTSHDIADNASGNAFPFGGEGLNLSYETNSEHGGNLRVGGAWYYTYRVQINNPVNSDAIRNVAIAIGPGGSVTNSITDPLRASVGDTVWLDANRNGVQDANEKPVAGIVVSLVDDNGNLVLNDKDLPYQVATDVNGNYLFKGVRPGKYQVVFDLPPYYVATEQDAGANDEMDSDIDATTGATEQFTLRGGEVKLDVDAGLVLVDDPASIRIVKLAGDAPDCTILELDTESGDVVYSYRVTNTGKTYLADVTVTDDKLGDVGTVEGLLAPGATVILTKTANVSENVVNVGTAVGTPVAKDGSEIPFLAQVSDTDDAEVTVVPVSLEPATIGDRVWNDVDGDGIQDDGELGIQGVTVNLLDAEGNVVATTVTDANGNYRFVIGDPGTYVVEFVPNSGWTFTTKDAGDNDALDSDADPATGRTPSFTVSAGQTDLTLDAGLVGGVPPGICSLIDVANKFNAFIGGDFTTDRLGGDTEGNLLVVGNATLGAGYSVGLIGPGYGRTREAAALGTDSLVVAGDLTETTAPDMNGNIVYGGTYTYSGETARILAYYDIRHVSPVTLDAAYNVPEDGSGRTLASIAADLRRFSSIVAALPESEGVVKDYSDPWDITWTGTNAFRNVFWVNAEDFNLTSKGITINVPAGSKIVVNVFGKTVTETYSDIYLPQGVDPSLVLFNFVDATSITTTGFEFHGSVLAPYANASFSGASIDGFAYIGGNVQTANGFEFHDFEFKAFDCSRSIVTVNKPAIGVSLSANGYDVGQIVRVAEGGTLDIVQKVANTGRTSLENVVLVDVLGNRYDLGTLAAGESKSVMVSAAAADRFSATATADVIAADGSAVPAYEGAKVSAAGSLKVQTLTAGALAAYEAAEAVAEAAKLGYIPRPDFEVTSIDFVNGSPTITGEVFSVVAKIKNVGETTAYPGKLALYVSHADIVELGETPNAVTNTTQSLEPGQEMAIKFTNIKAPGEGGPHHVRVLVDADNAVEELSEGNNQLPLFYFLNNIAVSIEIQGSTLTLTWNSYEGQAYTVRAATALDAFEDYIPAGSDGLDNLGYFHMPATPPFNTVTIDLNGADARFFKIRVDNLADEVR